jgi:glycoprotein 3-alpha-L-fucosyltransferase
MFAHELAKYIQVDIYGACGTFKCSRTTADKCFDILDRDYKFYLAFENSNCRDYITEKFFVNGLSRNTLPIVVSEYDMLIDKAKSHSSLVRLLDGSSTRGL